MNKLVIVCFLATLAVFGSAQQQTPPPTCTNGGGGDLCHTCEIMVNDIYYDFNYDFSSVTDAQLRAQMQVLCKQCFTGFEQTACISLLGANEPRIMQALRANEDALTVCKQAGVC
uniref:Saposin B-type domain-containing protein n=1 Tax=Plectus sambesii TaxID=2011161 RepID=A0A914VC68_9BILA